MASQVAIAALTTAGGAVVYKANTSESYVCYKAERIFENSDANRCYVLLGPGTVSATNYSFSLAQNEKVRIDCTADIVQAVWGTAAGGFLMATEWVN